jgi:hypothetical protein
MGPFRVYGALYGVWGPSGCMGSFRVYGVLDDPQRTHFEKHGPSTQQSNVDAAAHVNYLAAAIYKGRSKASSWRPVIDSASLASVLRGDNSTMTFYKR